MNYSAHAWKQTACVNHDRVDGVDGWGSPVIDWSIRAFHPYLVYDVQSYEDNPRWVEGWPTQRIATSAAGKTIQRELIVYCDAVDVPSRALMLSWSGHWQGLNSTVFSGQLPSMEIEAGFHKRLNVTMTIPTPPAEALAGATATSLQLVFELSDAASHAILFVEDRVRLLVTV